MRQEDCHERKASLGCIIAGLNLNTQQEALALPCAVARSQPHVQRQEWGYRVWQRCVIAGQVVLPICG